MTNSVASIIQRSWAGIIGMASTTIGILRFFIPKLQANIPIGDGIMHVITGVLFLGSAILFGGRFTRVVNISLGAVYIVFGLMSMNVPHIAVGLLSIILGVVVKDKGVARLL